MTFAWHFCFWACFCFPCCLECLPLFCHDPNPANPSKLRLNPSLMNAAHAALGSLNPAGLLFVPHSLHFLLQSSIYRSLVLNCFICISFTFSETLSALYAFYFFWVLTVFHAISRHSKKSRVPIWCHNLYTCMNVKEVLLSVLAEMEKYYWDYKRKIRKGNIDWTLIKNPKYALVKFQNELP